MREPYCAGQLTSGGRHRIGVDLFRTNIAELEAIVLVRIMEDWCLTECCDAWRVEQDARRLTVIFDGDQDCVLFCLTPECELLRTAER